MAYFEILTCGKIYLDIFQFFKAFVGWELPWKLSMLPVRGQERILAIISDWAKGGGGGTYQMRWCGWATETMKSSSKIQ